MLVTRDLKAEFDRALSVFKMVALVGARQSGKTTFLKHEMVGRSANYVSLDDVEKVRLFERNVKQFELLHIKGHDFTILDEVQNCEEAGPKLKYLVDTGRRLWVTSSSEVVLSKDVLAHLVGRVAILRLYPFNLREFLEARGERGIIPMVLERMVWEHMTFGGYPEAILTDDRASKRSILASLHETMLLKDVSKTFSIENLRGLQDLSMYLAAISGGIVRYDTVAADLRIMVPTLKKYLDALEKSYMIFTVRPYSTNAVKEIVKQPKVYFLDTGLRNAVADEFKPDVEGRQFENYILGELVKMGFRPRYWRSKGGAEVDFIVQKGGQMIPIEVKLRSDRERVGKGMRSFIDSYRVKSAFVVFYKGEPGHLRVGGCRIAFTDVLGLWDKLGGRPYPDGK